MSRYVIREEDDSSDFAVGMLVFMFFASIIAIIVGIFGAFIAVGVVWGTLTSVRNYILAVKFNGMNLGTTVSYAWQGNIASMKFFFDAAHDYDHIMPYFVKPFLIMAGVGVIIVGTVLLPVWMLFHVIGMIFVLPFKGTSNNSFDTQQSSVESQTSVETDSVADSTGALTVISHPTRNITQYDNGFIDKLAVRAETALSTARTDESKEIAAKVFESVKSSEKSCCGLDEIEAKLSANFSVFSDAVYHKDDVVASAVGEKILSLLSERNNFAKLNK